MIRKPWLLLPASWANVLSPIALKIYSRFFKIKQIACWKPVHWRHLYFPNPLGTAGGVDKNALHIKDWWSLGAGFVEIGTVTPKNQKANPSKILDRSLKYHSLWNNMGFPNKGLDFMRKQLSQLPKKKPTPIFVNIGKNRETSLSRAFEDYKEALERLYTFADVFVINISSPNTKDLRQLYNEDTFPSFLKSLKKVLENLDSKIPLILKMSPDEQDFLRIINQSLKAGIDGWCLCNTTTKRSVANLFSQHGGVSGQLLADQSLNLLRELKKYLSEKKIEDKLIISCGGVFTSKDILDRLNEGADLVQVYSALVFEGPGFFQSKFQEISNRS